jgi:teichuronic acid biosynthesis glycosyltransferase TuaG
MSSFPLVSVVMPAYNAAAYISASIQSVLDQTYPHLELIIIDDCSTDNTREIVEAYQAKDERIILRSNPHNLRVAATRNKGIEAARGKYLAFLDSDDLWLPNKLQYQVELLESGSVDMLCSSYFRFYADGKEVLVNPPKRIDFSGMMAGNPVGNLTGIYNCEKLGKFYQKAVGHEDYIMWIHIVKAAGLATGIQIPLAKYRVLETSVSSNKFRSAYWVWLVFRNELQMNLFSSGINFYKYFSTSIFTRIKKYIHF